MLTVPVKLIKCILSIYRFCYVVGMMLNNHTCSPLRFKNNTLFLIQFDSLRVCWIQHFFFGAMTTEKNTDVIVVCVFFGWFLLLLFSFLVGKFLQFFIMNHRIIATFIEIPQIMNYMPIYCCNQLLSFFSGARFMKYAYDNYLS